MHHTLRFVASITGLLIASPAPRRRRTPPAFGACGPGLALAWPWTVSAPERIHLGRDVRLGPHAWLALTTVRERQVTQGREVPEQVFAPELRIGDRVTFGRDLTIACLGRVEIGDDVLGGDRVLIADTFHDYRDPSRPIATQPMAEPRAVTIGAGAFLGTGAVVNPGVRIGEGAVVAAGSVVTRDVPACSHVGGAPARVLKTY